MFLKLKNSTPSVPHIHCAALITQQSLAAKLTLKYQTDFRAISVVYWMNIPQSTCKVYECGPNHQCVTGLFMKTLRNPKSHFCQCCRPEWWPPEQLTSKSCHFAFVSLDMKDQVQIQNQIQNQILISDESPFMLEGVDGRGRVWKRRNERLVDPCIS